MKNLKSVILEAEKRKVAVGHFNISNTEQFWGVFNAAKKLNVPVIIGVSEGERDFIGIRQVVALVKSAREEFDYPIFINADHTYSFDRVKEVVDAGFDSVIFDGAGLSTVENILITKKCVEYAKEKNPNILIEGELGFIGVSSKIFDDLPHGVSIENDLFTKPEDAKNFVKETGVDMLAPSVGNIHGMFRSEKSPALDIKRIEEIRKICGVPLVLHGGSGISIDDFKNAIKAGISTVHINTEIRLAYRRALELSLQDDPDEIAPYKYLKRAVLGIEKVVEEKLKIFNNII